MGFRSTEGAHDNAERVEEIRRRGVEVDPFGLRVPRHFVRHVSEHCKQPWGRLQMPRQGLEGLQDLGAGDPFEQCLCGMEPLVDAPVAFGPVVDDVSGHRHEPGGLIRERGHAFEH